MPPEETPGDGQAPPDEPDDDDHGHIPPGVKPPQDQMPGPDQPDAPGPPPT